MDLEEGSLLAVTPQVAALEVSSFLLQRVGSNALHLLDEAQPEDTAESGNGCVAPALPSSLSSSSSSVSAPPRSRDLRRLEDTLVPGPRDVSWEKTEFEAAAGRLRPRKGEKREDLVCLGEQRRVAFASQTALKGSAQQQQSQHNTRFRQNMAARQQKEQKGFEDRDRLADRSGEDSSTNSDLRTQGGQYLWRRIRRSTISDDKKIVFSDGSVMGWLSPAESDFISPSTGKLAALFRVLFDSGELEGDEEDLEESELLESLLPLSGLAGDPHCGLLKHGPDAHRPVSFAGFLTTRHTRGTHDATTNSTTAFVSSSSSPTSSFVRASDVAEGDRENFSTSPTAAAAATTVAAKKSLICSAYSTISDSILIEGNSSGVSEMGGSCGSGRVVDGGATATPAAAECDMSQAQGGSATAAAVSGVRGGQDSIMVDDNDDDDDDDDDDDGDMQVLPEVSSCGSSSRGGRNRGDSGVVGDKQESASLSFSLSSSSSSVNEGVVVVAVGDSVALEGSSDDNDEISDKSFSEVTYSETGPSCGGDTVEGVRKHHEVLRQPNQESSHCDSDRGDGGNTVSSEVVGIVAADDHKRQARACPYSTNGKHSNGEEQGQGDIPSTHYAPATNDNASSAKDDEYSWKCEVCYRLCQDCDLLICDGCETSECLECTGAPAVKLSNFFCVDCDKSVKERSLEQHKVGTSSKFYGVSFYPGGKKWLSYIQLKGKTVHLGCFDTEIEAARNSNEHALRHGKPLNFPKAAQRLRDLLMASSTDHPVKQNKSLLAQNHGCTPTSQAAQSASKSVHPAVSTSTKSAAQLEMPSVHFGDDDPKDKEGCVTALEGSPCDDQHGDNESFSEESHVLTDSIFGGDTAKGVAKQEQVVQQPNQESSTRDGDGGDGKNTVLEVSSEDEVVTVDDDDQNHQARKGEGDAKQEKVMQQLNQENNNNHREISPINSSSSSGRSSDHDMDASLDIVSSGGSNDQGTVNTPRVSAQKNPYHHNSVLPPGWTAHQSHRHAERCYFLNKSTGEKDWRHPAKRTRRHANNSTRQPPPTSQTRQSQLPPTFADKKQSQPAASIVAVSETREGETGANQQHVVQRPNQEIHNRDGDGGDGENTVLEMSSEDEVVAVGDDDHGHQARALSYSTNGKHGCGEEREQGGVPSTHQPLPSAAPKIVRPADEPAPSVSRVSSVSYRPRPVEAAASPASGNGKAVSKKLIELARSGKDDGAKVKLFANAGVDLDFVDENGYTALTWAACNGHKIIVGQLINAKAKFDLKNGNGDTARDLACRYKQNHWEEVVRLLDAAATSQEATANNRARGLQESASTSSQVEGSVGGGGQKRELSQSLQTPASLSSSNSNSVSSSSSSSSNLSSSFNGRASSSSSPLPRVSFAAANHDRRKHPFSAFAACQQSAGANLLTVGKEGSAFVSSLDSSSSFSSSSTARNAAVASGNGKALGKELRELAQGATDDGKEAKRLIDNGADVNALDEGGHTALMWAVFNAYKEIAKNLLKAEANVDLQNKSGKTALMIATLKDHEPNFDQLTNAKANTDLQNKGGLTALMLAAQKGDASIVAKLIKVKAGLCIRDNNGYTALCWAEFSRKNQWCSVVKRLKTAASAHVEPTKNSRNRGIQKSTSSLPQAEDSGGGGGGQKRTCAQSCSISSMPSSRIGSKKCGRFNSAVTSPSTPLPSESFAGVTTPIAASNNHSSAASSAVANEGDASSSSSSTSTSTSESVPKRRSAAENEGAPAAPAGMKRDEGQDQEEAVSAVPQPITENSCVPGLQKGPFSSSSSPVSPAATFSPLSSSAEIRQSSSSSSLPTGQGRWL